jgi:hypothetical protein
MCERAAVVSSDQQYATTTTGAVKANPLSDEAQEVLEDGDDEIFFPAAASFTKRFDSNEKNKSCGRSSP